MLDTLSNKPHSNPLSICFLMGRNIFYMVSCLNFLSIWPNIWARYLIERTFYFGSWFQRLQSIVVGRAFQGSSRSREKKNALTTGFLFPLYSFWTPSLSPQDGATHIQTFLWLIPYGDTFIHTSRSMRVQYPWHFSKFNQVINQDEPSHTPTNPIHE